MRETIRVSGMKVTITLGVAPDSLRHLETDSRAIRGLRTVSQSVRTGIPFTVTVKSPEGRLLKKRPFVLLT
ncbi:MAG TPA: hypothetical protein VEI49_05195 [Terriglobales bacterium]|nr:hypothetical protein [Terriglobales bacterium]